VCILFKALKFWDLDISEAATAAILVMLQGNFKWKNHDIKKVKCPTGCKFLHARTY
jgi:hypothetical protein